MSNSYYEFEAPKQKELNEQKKGKGVTYMFISAAFFTASAAMLKVLYLNSGINTYEFTYW
jgi:hypothetical protein